MMAQANRKVAEWQILLEIDADEFAEVTQGKSYWCLDGNLLSMHALQYVQGDGD